MITPKGPQYFEVLRRAPKAFFICKYLDMNNNLFRTSCRDVPVGERGGGAPRPLNIFKFARELVKRQPCCKRVDNSIFCEFLVAIAGQLVKTPPHQQKVSPAHH